jgi:hypothetical protein
MLYMYLFSVMHGNISVLRSYAHGESTNNMNNYTTHIIDYYTLLRMLSLIFMLYRVFVILLHLLRMIVVVPNVVIH